MRIKTDHIVLDRSHSSNFKTTSNISARERACNRSSTMELQRALFVILPISANFDVVFYICNYILTNPFFCIFIGLFVPVWIATDMQNAFNCTSIVTPKEMLFYLACNEFSVVGNFRWKHTENRKRYVSRITTKLRFFNTNYLQNLTIHLTISLPNMFLL